MKVTKIIRNGREKGFCSLRAATAMLFPVYYYTKAVAEKSRAQECQAMVESSSDDSQTNLCTVSTRTKARGNLVHSEKSNDRLKRPHVSFG